MLALSRRTYNAAVKQLSNWLTADDSSRRRAESLWHPRIIWMLQQPLCLACERQVTLLAIFFGIKYTNHSESKYEYKHYTVKSCLARSSKSREFGLHTFLQQLFIQRWWRSASFASACQWMGFLFCFDKSQADSLSFECLAAVFQIHRLQTRRIYIVGRQCFAVCTTGLCTGFYPHSRCYTSLTLQTYGCCTSPIFHCYCRSTACWQLMETANEPLLSEAPSGNIWPSRCSKQLGKPFPEVSLLKTW